MPVLKSKFSEIAQNGGIYSVQENTYKFLNLTIDSSISPNMSMHHK